MATTVTTLQKKFRGCLLGTLIGDNMGEPYEGKEISKEEIIGIQRYFDKLDSELFIGPFRQYTDDTAMMMSVAKFFVEKTEPDYGYLARLFVEEYFREPERGYGQGAMEILHKLKKTKFVDVYQPAKEQFDGSGSYGNGGAMRIAPVALYYHDDYDMMLEVAANSTKLTHTNPLGINGALLQCMAIQQSLELNPDNPVDPVSFCTKLRERIKPFENSVEVQKYEEKLKTVESLLKIEHSEGIDEEVICELGHGINAFESVPTAIYCFLRAQKDIPSVKTNNMFRRTVQYAITLGGDTDTIANMAGAIAGAYIGENGLSDHLIEQCELYQEVIEMADQLYAAKEKKQSHL